MNPSPSTQNRSPKTRVRSLSLLLAALLLATAPLASGCIVRHSQYRRAERPRRVCRTVRTVRYRTVYRWGVPYRQRYVTRHRECRWVRHTVHRY